MPFDVGGTPTIIVINKALTPIGYDLGKTVAALQKHLDDDFFPIWGARANLQIVDPTAATPDGVWQLLVVDSAAEPGAEGYHELTNDGFPLMYVGVKDTLGAGDKVPVTMCHEIDEGLIDPAINVSIYDSDGNEFGAEVCDAVETDEYLIDDIPMSNFQTPAWFEGFRKPGDCKFDFMGLCKHSFEIREGGYMPVKKRGRWTQIFGSMKSKEQHKRRSRRRMVLRRMGGKYSHEAHQNAARAIHANAFEKYVW
jgi:hypothetical protein